MSYISKMIHKGWNYILTFSTPLIGLYALYDIQEMLFNEERKERYSKKDKKMRKFESVEADIKNKKKNTPIPVVTDKPNKRKIISMWIVNEEIVYAVKGSRIEFGPDVNTSTDVKWTKDGKPVQSTFSERTKFRINNVSSEDKGLYICMIETKKMKFKYHLIVKDYTKDFKEVFIEKLKQKYQELQSEIIYERIAIESTKSSPEQQMESTKSSPEQQMELDKQENIVEGKQIELMKLGIMIEEQQIELVKIRSFIDTEHFGLEQMDGKLIHSDWLIQNKTTVTGTEITAVFQNGSTKKAEIGRDVPDNSKPKWTKNGKSLNSGNSPFVCFVNISLEDEGLYVCTFEQDNIQLELKYHVIVVDYQETVFVKMGDDIEFGKTVPDEYMSTNATWKSPKDLKTAHFEPTKYIIKNVSSADIGRYLCEFGPPECRSKITYILTETGTEEVVLISKYNKAQFGIYIVPPDVSAHAYKWTKNGEDFESELAMVNIRNVSLEDEGLYVCKYGSKNMQSKYHLIVTGTEETVFVKSGERASFGKTIPGDSFSKNAKWTQNEQEITSTHSKPTKFIIENASSGDEGLYICTLKFENMQLKYHLIVVEHEETILAVKDQSTELGKTIPYRDVSNTLKWTKNGNDIQGTQPVRTKFKIDKVSSGDEGLYVCKFGKENMQLRYRLIVADQREPTVQKEMLEKGPFTTLTIRSPGKDMSDKWNIDIGRNGLTLSSETTVENTIQFVYENEKYKEDKYKHVDTEVFLKKPGDIYIVIKMLKKIS